VKIFLEMGTVMRSKFYVDSNNSKKVPWLLKILRENTREIWIDGFDISKPILLPKRLI
jgi:hypothetical protein